MAHLRTSCTPRPAAPRTPRSAPAALLAALGAALAAAPAAAQGTITYSEQLAYAAAYYNQGFGDIGNAGGVPDYSGADFYGIEDHSFTGGGFSGRGYAEHGATFTPSNPLVGGSFSSVILDACTSAHVSQSNINSHVFEVAYGVAIGQIEFTLTTAVNWTWNGGWQGTSFNTGAFNLVSADLILEDINTNFSHVGQTMGSLNGQSNWSQAFAFAGTLGPGDYRLAWRHESIVTGGSTAYGLYPTALGGAPLVSCINSVFSMVPVPAPGTGAALLIAGALGVRRRR